MSESKCSAITGIAIGSLVAIGATIWFYKTICELESELERQKSLRVSERQGRIRAEQRKPSELSPKGEMWPMYPIGYVRSVFCKRLGTPRQPSIVNAAESVIEIVPELHAGIDSLEVYSHLWVLFVFNQNTNIQKRSTSKKAFDGLKLLVEPPKAKGAKVGVLSCRTPHRPNPIGLSLCRIVKVEKGAITVAGLDCLDGSPVLDIKPYLPIIECVSDATVPDWIYQGVDEDKAMTVEWEIADYTNRFDPQLILLVEETLSRDIRSRNQIRIGETMMGKDWVGELRLKGWTVNYSVNKDSKTVEIFSLAPSVN